MHQKLFAFYLAAIAIFFFRFIYFIFFFRAVNGKWQLVVLVARYPGNMIKRSGVHVQPACVSHGMWKLQGICETGCEHFLNTGCSVLFK